MDIQFVFHFVIDKYNWVTRDTIKCRMILKYKLCCWKFIGESKQIEATQKMSPLKFSSLNLGCLSWIFWGYTLLC